jgi:ribonucleoside-diphosphate reductase alpha chain
MPDYIMRWLASRFGDADLHEELGILTPEVRSRKASQEALMRGDTAGPPAPAAESASAEDEAPAAEDSTGGGNGNGGKGHTSHGPASSPGAGTAARPPTAALTDEPPAIPARLQGLDLGPACAMCGGMMQRTGSCYTCSSCGNNTGCG